MLQQFEQCVCLTYSEIYKHCLTASDDFAFWILRVQHAMLIVITHNFIVMPKEECSPQDGKDCPPCSTGLSPTHTHISDPQVSPQYYCANQRWQNISCDGLETSVPGIALFLLWMRVKMKVTCEK